MTDNNSIKNHLDDVVKISLGVFIGGFLSIGVSLIVLGFYVSYIHQ